MCRRVSPSWSRRPASGSSCSQWIRHLPVEHEGNSQASPEEADAIAAELERLVGRAYTPAEASPRPLRHEDVMIVAPYNLQVPCLRGRLPEAVRVETVDKFQGQQAPVVFYSTASSSGAEIPRGLEFLLSRNRLNVAISRAQCLAYLSAARACSMSSAARSSRCGWLTLSVAPPRWPRGGRQA